MQRQSATHGRSRGGRRGRGRGGGRGTRSQGLSSSPPIMSSDSSDSIESNLESDSDYVCPVCGEEENADCEVSNVDWKCYV